MVFNKEEFELWFTENAELIYSLTGIAHYNAHDKLNIGLLKIIFIQDKRISELESRKKILRKKKNER